MATVRHSAHNGAQAFYAIRAAEQGMLAIALTNTEPLVIPFGGAEPALGTNPICLAAPTGGGVFDLDMATSQVAINRIFNARDEGRPIPEGWGVDEHGRPTTDAAAVASAVPLGGYKGYALAVMVEVLCGVLAGAGVRHGVGGLYTGADVEQDVGHFHLALDPERTVGRERFAAVLGGLLGELRAIPPAPGFDEVLVPGDPGGPRAGRARALAACRSSRRCGGRCSELSRELGVAVPQLERPEEALVVALRREVAVGLARREFVVSAADALWRRGHLADRVLDAIVGVARADHEDRARPVAGADEHVPRAGRAVHEVPLARAGAPAPRRSRCTRRGGRGSPPGCSPRGRGSSPGPASRRGR